MIRQGRSTIDELGNTLRSLGPVSVRLMMRRTDEELRLVTGIVEAGRNTAGFEEATYDYGHVAFVKAVLDGSAVAAWLAGRSGEGGGLGFSLPEASPDCHWELTASRAPGRYGTRLPVPHTEYSILSANRTEPPSHGSPLAGVGRPFFPDETVAAASVLLDDHSPSAHRSIPHDLLLIRIAHPEASIGRVRVSSTAITPLVLGDDLEGVELQVSSAGARHERPVSKPGDIPVPISGAERADVWVVLARGHECLDFRTISSRWPASGDREGISYEPDDLDDRLDRLRLGGESERVEFKESPPKGEGIPRTVAAFANGNGGMIIVGIRDGTGEVAGVKGDVTAACDSLHNIVRNNVRPLPEYELSRHSLEGRAVVAIRVAAGDDRPYGVTGKDGPGPRYYVRRGATNWIAESEELRAISQPRQSRDRDEAGNLGLVS